VLEAAIASESRFQYRARRQSNQAPHSRPRSFLGLVFYPTLRSPSRERVERHGHRAGAQRRAGRAPTAVALAPCALDQLFSRKASHRKSRGGSPCKEVRRGGRLSATARESARRNHSFPARRTRGMPVNLLVEIPRLADRWPEGRTTRTYQQALAAMDARTRCDRPACCLVLAPASIPEIQRTRRPDAKNTAQQRRSSVEQAVGDSGPFEASFLA
jgi:hypothetical protein